MNRTPYNKWKPTLAEMKLGDIIVLNVDSSLKRSVADSARKMGIRVSMRKIDDGRMEYRRVA